MGISKSQVETLVLLTISLLYLYFYFEYHLQGHEPAHGFLHHISILEGYPANCSKISLINTLYYVNETIKDALDTKMSIGIFKIYLVRVVERLNIIEVKWLHI
jgi:hypothetical protein